MGDNLKNRREFLGKLRDWLVGGVYAMIPLSLFSRGGTKHLFEIDTEKGPRPLQEVTCNCDANSAVRVIALHQGQDDTEHHTGCACTSSSTKAATRTQNIPKPPPDNEWQCSCRGQYTRAEAHAAANDN